MSLWMKNGKLIANSTGNPIDCEEYCPCTEPVPPGPGPGDDDYGPISPEIHRKKFAQITDLDLGFNPHNTEQYPNNSGEYDRTHTLTYDWDEESDRVVSSFFIPNDDKFYRDKTYQNRTAYYQIPLTNNINLNEYTCNIPILKEYTKLYEQNYLSGNGEAFTQSDYISAHNLNNQSLEISIPSNIEENTLLTSIVINNCDSDIQNESSNNITFAQFALSTRSNFNGGEDDANYTVNMPDYNVNETHLYKAKLRQQRDIYVRKLISGINFSYIIDTINPNVMDNNELLYRANKTTGYCGAIADFDHNSWYYFYYDNTQQRYYTAYYNSQTDTFKYTYDDGNNNLDHVKQFINTTARSRITSCHLINDTDNWNDKHPLYTNLKFTFQNETYYIYRAPAFMASEGFYNNNDHHKNKDDITITGNDFDNIVVLSGGSKRNISSGWLIANNDYFYILTYNSSSNRWQFRNDIGYVYITGGTSTTPPPYYYDRSNYKVNPIFSGHYIKNTNDRNVILIKENFYDYHNGSLIQDYLINIHENPPIDDMKKRLNRGLAKQLNPFLIFQISGALTNTTSDDTRTLSSCISDTLKPWGYSTQYDFPTIASYRDMIGGTDNGYCRDYGGGNFSIHVTKFKKMTTSQINTYCTNNSNYYQKGMSATLNNLCGIYCEIFNAFCVQTATWGDAVESTGFRIRQSWKQVMAFDTWYQFGMNVPVFNLLTAYSSAPYYSLISPFVNINNKSTATYQKWWNKFAIMNSLVIIRPISGVYELTNDDGHDKWVHQNNWVPTQ